MLETSSFNRGILAPSEIDSGYKIALTELYCGLCGRGKLTQADSGLTPPAFQRCT